MSEGKVEDVKLLGVWASPFVLRTVFALNLKKVTYELVPADPIKKSELLLTLNPIYKKIPVLLHGDRTICESMIIVEYVDTIWKNEGPPILPSDPYDKAMSRFWVTYIDDKKTLEKRIYSIRNLPIQDLGRDSSYKWNYGKRQT